MNPVIHEDPVAELKHYSELAKQAAKKVTATHPLSIIRTDPIVRVVIGDNLILQTDADGKELVRLELMVRERRQKDVFRAVEFQFPLADRWDDYVEKCATLFFTLNANFDDLSIPEEFDKLNKKDFKTWCGLVAARFKVKAHRGLLTNILYDYLDPLVDDMSPEESVDWLKKNITIVHIPYIFTAILEVDSFIEKKSSWILIHRFQMETQSLSSPTSPPVQITPLTKSNVSPFSGLDFSSPDLQSQLTA